MPRNLSLAIALSALVAAPLAQAGVGDNAGGVLAALQGASPVERAQYYVFDDVDYCWYDDGWNGPGWYACDYEWYEDWGWGGPWGWNGWGGGHRIRRQAQHGAGVWHGEAHPHVPAGGTPHFGGGSPHFGGGSPNFGVGPGASPSFHGFSGGTTRSFGGYGGGAWSGGGHGGHR